MELDMQRLYKAKRVEERQNPTVPFSKRQFKPLIPTQQKQFEQYASNPKRN
jgi:hypothetical protein